MTPKSHKLAQADSSQAKNKGAVRDEAAPLFVDLVSIYYAWTTSWVSIDGISSLVPPTPLVWVAY